MAKKAASNATQAATEPPPESTAQVATEQRVTLPEVAHAVADFVHDRCTLLATNLIRGGKLGHGAAIAAAAEDLISQIRTVFPNA
jgi:hypothetical protein